MAYLEGINEGESRPDRAVARQTLVRTWTFFGASGADCNRNAVTKFIFWEKS
jgi:hypothetical protein